MSDVPLRPTILDAALLAHAKGFTPVALRPEHKAPTDSSWPTATYQDTDSILTAFTASSARFGGDPTALNLGLALGSRHGNLVNIDIDHHKALTLAQTILPPTPMRSGRPGRPGAHWWYIVQDYDPGIRPHKLPNGAMIVEYRAGGGQTVVPPSTHPDGEPYEWWGDPWGGDEGPRVLSEIEGKRLHAAVVIIALIVTLADAWPERGSRHAAYLPLVGGLLRDADETGAPRVHPWWEGQVEGIIRRLAEITHDADGAETRIAETVRTTRQKIIRGDLVQGWPTLAQIIGDAHVSKALAYVEQVEDLLGVPRTRVRRELSHAAPLLSPDLPPVEVLVDEIDEETARQQQEVDYELRPDSERDPLRERTNEWQPLDLGPYIRGGIVAPVPGLLYRTDGHGLFYEGRVNSLYGAGGSGKTLLALHTASQVMAQGQRVMLIDFEDEPHNTLARFDALGVDLDLVADRFAYIRPESAPLASLQVDRWGNPVQTAAGRRNEEELAAALAKWEPSLIIVDGTTTLFRVHGQDTNAGNGADLIGGWLRRLTDNGARTVILIDHTGKAASAGSQPVGSQHKIAMIQGTALHVYAPNKPRKGQCVQTSLYVGKDRPGEVGKVSVDAAALLAAEVTFDSTGDLLRILVNPPGGSTRGGSGDDGLPVDIPRSRTDLERQAILDVLRNAPGTWMTRKEILLAAGLSMTDRVWENRRDALLGSNLIQKQGDNKGTRYRLTP